MRKILIILLLIISCVIITLEVKSQSYDSWEYLGWNSSGKEKEIEKNSKLLASTSIDKIIVPVLFGIDVKNIKPNFGELRGSRKHYGLDIVVPEYTPVISPTDAVVANIGNGTSSGYFVSTLNPGGETFIYMHLAEIEAKVESGVFIQKGTVIGYVGNTGNAIGTSPHLHFEIRKSGVIDPYKRIVLDAGKGDKQKYLTKFLHKTDKPVKFLRKVFKNHSAELLTLTEDSLILNQLVIKIIDGSNVDIDINLPSDVPEPVNLKKETKFTRSLTVGDTGEDVKNLQILLINRISGKNSKKLNDVGATGEYGTLTKEALREFQLSNKILPATGNFGPKTRSFFEKL